MKTFYLAPLAGLILALAACSNEDGPAPVAPDPVVTPPALADWQPAPLRSVAEANVGRANGFALDLFKKTMATGEDNLCLSPVSVFACLAMAANGDSGDTRDEVLTLLGYDPDELSQLNIFCNALMTEAKALNGGTECDFANSFWYHPDLHPSRNFLATLNTVYDASVYDTWLGDARGMEMVNDYISDNTRGLIPQFLSEPLDVRVALINATYFKGAWKVAFDKELTRTATFHNLDGTSARTEFMYRDGDFESAVTPSLRAVRLPYLGDRYTMTFIQPSDGGDFATMLADLTPATLQALDGSFLTSYTPLLVPRFEASVSIDLLDQLKDMGLSLACSSGFDSICEDDRFSITCVRHGVKLIVDEEGTEAAGATIIGMDNALPSVLSFDRPFVYLIRDTISDTVLFIGAVTKF